MVTLLQDEQASLKLKLGSSDVHAHQSDLSHTRIIVSSLLAFMSARAASASALSALYLVTMC